MRLDHCRAVVTGASGGIGRAVAERMCREGAHVLLVGRRVESLREIQTRFPGQVSVVHADLTTAAGRDVVSAAARAFGHANCLINCAGAGGFALVEDQDDAALETLVATNITSVLQLTRRLLPALREADEAVVLNVGSTLGSIGYPGYAAYSATKFALRGYSEALRRELADTRIRVLYVAPRATRTDMNSAAVEAMNRDLGVGMDSPQQVAASVLLALTSGRQETYLGWPERLFVRINGLLPRCVDRALRKHLPVVRRFAGDPANERRT
ncbi:MAG: SDR family oxidoreductase, partial [Pseudazoarcus pumilus]|nr:SDR family oxidoreductase [Pseudazoarcus pumilus]